ncbi:hypothetical protein CBL_02846 [Carabus blaptoides fortunei]
MTPFDGYWCARVDMWDPLRSISFLSALHCRHCLQTFSSSFPPQLDLMALSPLMPWLTLLHSFLLFQKLISSQLYGYTFIWPILKLIGNDPTANIVRPTTTIAAAKPIRQWCVLANRGLRETQWLAGRFHQDKANAGAARRRNNNRRCSPICLFRCQEDMTRCGAQTEKEEHVT